ncbi:MAG: amidohydrolase family protein [Pseudomonadota bacterium]|nr:amidohydrolase family protein [Pseudomonadota bacterium]
MSIPRQSIGFVNCDWSPFRAAHDHAVGSPNIEPSARRRVVIDGKKIRTVDIHAHCAVPAALDVIQKTPGRSDLSMEDKNARLASMNKQGLDMAVLSVNPWWYHLEYEAAEAVIKIQNEGLAEICHADPDRFIAFASIALQHPDLAVDQIEYGVNNLGLRGINIGCYVEGRELSDPFFHPVWAKCEELDLLVFMHPRGTNEMVSGGRLTGGGALANTIGNPLETTLALSHLIFEGTLDRFPGLKICAVHGGGYFASYAHRSDAVIRTFSHQRVQACCKYPPTHYLKNGQLYFDSIVFDPAALRYLISQTGADKIMIGTDYPFGWSTTEVDLVLQTPELSNDDRTAILGGNAARLLNIPTD